ncbi:MAG: hypothetical protein QOI20_2533 [Acidimicrobiaceae bacterium]|nr:hypothetical protein [Acidimicrobiaceae bacterium]
MRTLDADLVLDAHAEVGEGPLWDADGGVLRWVDIPAGLVYGGDDQPVSMGRAVGFVVPRAGGGFVVGAVGGLYDLASGALVVPLGADEPGTRLNDGKCDGAGRVWAGVMDDGAAPGAGRLVCVEADGSVAVRLDGLTIPNGLDWSLDGRTMYYVDSPTHRIDAFDFDPGTGEMTGRRPWVTVPDEVLPDGLTVDSEGAVWVALWGGGAVHRYTADGALDTVVRVPVSQAASCAFGGPGLDVLYITTAAAGLSPEALAAEPHAGGVFACTPGPVGRPAHPYAG